MKTTKNILLVALMAVLSISAANAQSQAQKGLLEEFEQSPKSTEKVIAVITKTINAGEVYGRYTWDPNYYRRNAGKWVLDRYIYNEVKYTEEQLLETLFSLAKEKYREEYPKFVLRDFNYTKDRQYDLGSGSKQEIERFTYICSAKVVITDPKEAAKENLSLIIEKAMRNVQTGSRVAIDQVNVIDGINEDDYRDNLIEILLDKGYKVIAKEFMQRLYEEQIQQQTGVYNEETMVQENNFSAVGYYINIRMTEETLRMQVVNVSTGEYEGNATINY